VDGRLDRFTLEGSAVPGSETRRAVTWIARTAPEFRDWLATPKATLEDGRLRLEGGTCAITLDVPAGASVVVECEDRSVVRVAWLYSLVVNARGDSFAECLEVSDTPRGTREEMLACTIETFEPQRGAQQPVEIGAA
jgi:hypothetical protein